MEVLIVDDESELVSSLVRFLSRFGHRCASAISCRQAMDHLVREHPQLVITDYRLPDGDGLGVLKAVHQKYPQTPVIMITGYHTQVLEATARKAGVSAYLRKPFALKELADAIRSV